ncbi:MAG: CHASE2 domain-containing protein [Dysgonamonadaceae bacterium]|jgi:hypothetical protein|nr:CHASE2 domain-containing protein [Dysgonamonadaceae bacterium]
MKQITNFILLKSLAVTLLSLELGLVFYVILDVNVLTNIVRQDGDADVLGYYYNIENRQTDDSAYESVFDNNVVIFDLDGSRSRADIARIIHGIEDFSPAAVVLDVIFPDVSDNDVTSDSLLAETVARFDNIYTAVRINGDTVDRSFFSEGGKGRIKEGLVNHITKYRPYEILEDDTIPYICFAVAGIEGEADEARLMNFLDKDFTVFSLVTEFSREDVEGKIILIGDLNDGRDAHDMPFRIDGGWRVPGIRLLAHSCSTTLSGRWIIVCPQYAGWIVASVFTFLFLVFCYRLDEVERLHSSIRSLIVASVRIILIVLLLLGGFIMFSRYDIIVSPLYGILSLTLTGFASAILEVCNFILNKFIPLERKR